LAVPRPASGKIMAFRAGEVTISWMNIDK